MLWRCGDVGVCACVGNEGHLYLSVPDRFRFSVSVTVPQMCFLPENKSGTSPLSVSLTDNTGRRQNCVKRSVRATVVFEVECLSLPQHAWPLTSPPCLCFPTQRLRKTDRESRNLKLFGLGMLKKIIEQRHNNTAIL